MPLKRPPEYPAGIQTALMLALCPLFLLFALLPMDSVAQMTATMPLIGIMWYCRSSLQDEEAGGFHHMLIMVLGTLITLRYITWRAMFTLGSHGLFNTTFTLVLFAAEVYSIGLYLLGLVVNAKPLDRPLLTMADLPARTEIPTVDVLVPSYNEEAGMLEVTLRAALAMDYPTDRLRVHLLDDGGTDQKIADPDPGKAQAARERRRTLRALCLKLGANYITRAKNEHAKAGNINSALKHISGHLVVILDADHIVTTDFLDHTVPWFIHHDDIFLVQTPHFMINPDPVDRNLLRSFDRMPSENDMFYDTIQRGLDFWSSSFFCGSAAVLRRRHLDEIGGLQGDSITEDAESALALHQRGYRSVYVAHPMVAGLAPETFAAFIIQRMRWAQGMTQILLLKRPFLASGLRWYQRIGYMSSMLFWLFPFARLAFLLSPLAYLLFGVEVYNASLREIFAYAIPHIIANYTVTNTLFGRTRWPIISEIYEILQCIFSLEAIIQVLLNPRKPAFMVTPKGDTLDEDFISPLARPFYILNLAVLLGFIGGLWRLYLYPLTRDLTTVVLLWNLFNFFTVVASLGVLFERHQRRSSPRMPLHEPGWIETAQGERLPCEVDDISAGGVRALVARQGAKQGLDDLVHLVAYSTPLGRHVRIPCRVRGNHPVHERIALGLKFETTTEREANDAVTLAFGDSARWAFFQQRRHREFPFWSAIRLLVLLVRKPIAQHLGVLLRHTLTGLSHIRRLPRMRPATREISTSD